MSIHFLYFYFSLLSAFFFFPFPFIFWPLYISSLPWLKVFGGFFLNGLQMVLLILQAML